MASSKERAWLSAHQKGSKALVQRLDKVHANNPEYQAFKKKHGLGDTSSVKQVSKSQVDAKKEKARQVLAGKAYGATKGTRMGSAEGTGETLRDTIAPLTRDQHSAVKAAEREAKAAEKPSKPAKPKKEKAAAPAPEKKKPTALELIAAAAAKRKINQIPKQRTANAVRDMERNYDYDDLGDTQYGGRHSYNEEVENFKVGDKVSIHAPDDLDWHERKGELVSTSDDGHVVKLSGGAKLSVSKHQIKKIDEEVEQIDEMKYGIGTVVKLKKPIDGHGYATVKGFTSSGSTRGPTGRGVPMPAGNVKKVKVALRKSDDHSYYAGPITHIEHGDVHSVIRESAPGWMLKQDPELAKKVEAKKKLAKKRQKQMGNPEPVKEAKHHMGGALFADTAARLQKAINAHKERMDQATNGPEHEYHHPTLDIKTKSRLKLPSPWVKVEDK